MIIRREIYDNYPNQIKTFMPLSMFKAFEASLLEDHGLTSLDEMDYATQRRLVLRANSFCAITALANQQRRKYRDSNGNTLDSADLGVDFMARLTSGEDDQFNPDKMAVRFIMNVFDKEGEQTWLASQHDANSVPAERMELAFQNARTVLAFTVKPPASY